ncbi:MAG: tetratricopeptide repeat protein, partial [Sedimentisphaerales bacterium]|nr:tetratricopeptide repeat protein [Sedimentisphaerales bacterium]
ARASDVEALKTQRKTVTMHLQRGQIEQAETALAELKQNYSSLPEYVKEVHELGWDFVKASQYDTALQIYLDLQQQFSEHERAAWFQRSIVQMYMEKDDIENAAQAVETMFSDYSGKPEFVRHAHELGWWFVEKADYKTALRIYNGLLEQFPNHDRAAWFQRSLVQTYLEQGDITKAAQAVEKLKTDFQSHPDYANQMKITADRLRSKKQNELADSIDEALKQLPDDKQTAVWKRTQIQNALNSGDTETAKAEVEILFSAYSSKPDFVKHAHELGWEFVKKADYDTALRIYNGLLEQFGDHERAAWFQRSVVQTYLERGDMEKAAQAVEKLKTDFQSHPDYANQMKITADRLRSKKQYALADSITDYLLNQLPDNEQAAQWKRTQIQNALNAGDSQTAKTEVETFFSDYSSKPGFVKQAHELGWQFVTKGQFETALRIYNGLLEQFGEHERAVWFQRSIAQTYLAQGDIIKALEAVEELKDNFQSHPDYVNQMEKVLGWLIDKGQPAAAKELGEFLLERFPEHPRAVWFQHYKTRSEIAMEQQEIADADVEVMRQKYNADPNLADALSWTAYNYRQAGLYERSIALNESVLALEPDKKIQLRCTADIARSYVRLGNNDQAMAKVNYILSNFGDNPQGLAFYLFSVGEEYYYKAHQYKYEGLGTKARDYFTKAIAVWEKLIQELPPSATTPRAYYLAARCCFKHLGEYEKAIEYCKKVVDNWSEDKYASQAQFLIGECYEQLRNSGGLPESEADPKIEQAYEAVVENYPDCASAKDALLKLGWLDFKRGQWAEAIQCWELSLEKYPENQRPHHILYPLGRAYEEIGWLDNAKQVYEEFIRTVFPYDPRIEMVKARLEKLSVTGDN